MLGQDGMKEGNVGWELQIEEDKNTRKWLILRHDIFAAAVERIRFFSDPDAVATIRIAYITANQPDTVDWPLIWPLFARDIFSLFSLFAPKKQTEDGKVH